MRSAIVTSRKRKLRELFAVATQADTLPDDGFANPDAPAATPAEWQFLQASDILQYVSRLGSRLFSFRRFPYSDPVVIFLLAARFATIFNRCDAFITDIR